MSICIIHSGVYFLKHILFYRYPTVRHNLLHLMPAIIEVFVQIRHYLLAYVPVNNSINTLLFSWAREFGWQIFLHLKIMLWSYWWMSGEWSPIHTSHWTRFYGTCRQHMITSKKGLSADLPLIFPIHLPSIFVLRKSATYSYCWKLR